MPYAPNVSYHGDQYLFNAISGAGNAIGNDLVEAMKKSEQLRQEAGLNDSIMQHALANGRVTQDEYNDYVQAPWGKKQGIANGIMANIHDDWQRQQFATEEKDKELQRALTLKIAEMAHAQDNFTPSWEPGGGLSEAAAAGGTLLPVGKGKYAFQPYGGAGSDFQPKQMTLPPPVDAPPGAKPITVFTSTPNQVMLSPSEAASGPTISQDRRFYLDNKTNSWKPLDSKMRRDLAIPPPEPVSDTGQPSALGRLYNWAFGSPAQPAQPTGPPNGAAPGVGPAAPTADAATQAAAIKQQYANGQITRADALKKLEALGYK